MIALVVDGSDRACSGRRAWRSKRARILWVGALALFSGNRTTAAETVSPTDSPPCRQVYGLSGLLEPGTILLLGGIHGTRESALFVSDLVCHAGGDGRSVAVALELPQAASRATDEYLESVGSRRDRDLLVTRIQELTGYRDGRFSEAIVDLIEAVRRLRRRGDRVRLTLIVPSELASEQRRERQMADNLARLAHEPDSDLVIALTGLLQSRLVKGTRWDPEQEPLGYLLRRGYPDRRLVSLAVSHSGGTAWVCTSTHVVDCRPLLLTGSGGGTANSVYLVGDVAATGYHGVYFVGELSYSPPAGPSLSVPDPAEQLVTEQPLATPP